MRSTLPLLVVLGLVGALMSLSACQAVECGPGTIDRGGECEPADLTVGTAKCGPLTVLKGDQCVPELPPTVCDPETTQPETDSKGVTKCIGTGGGGCSAPLPCPDPATGKHTICGQIYNFIDNTPLVAPGATGAKCTPGATDGPCALKIVAKNAQQPFDPLPTGDVYIDDCGRYRVSDITPPTALTVLEFDDADARQAGPTGITAPTLVGFRVAELNRIGRARAFEAFVVNKAAIDQWASVGLMVNAVYVAIFRAHGCDLSTGKCNNDGDRLANRAGVALVGMPKPPLALRYFVDGPKRQQLAPETTVATTSNGAAVANLDPTNAGGITNVDGDGALPDTCMWPTFPAGPIPGHVLFQVFRPVDNGAQKCTQ